MSVKKRLEQFCEHRGIAIGTFCREARISNSYFSNVRGEMGTAVRGKIKDTFKDLNLNWLLTGEGEMLVVDEPKPIQAAVMSPMANGEATPMMPIQANIDTGEVNGVDISDVPAEIVEEIEEKVKEEMSIPIITSEIASTPNTNIKKYIRDKGDELKRIYINDLTQGAKVAECVESISMWPTFQPGDWVFVKFIDKGSVVDGKTYYFDLNTLPTMIRKVKIENDKLRLIAKNPNYGDIIIGYDEVNNIADIVGTWRSYFGDQYDEIEAVRRLKDGQIDKLIDQNSKALESIGELIEVIKDKK